MPISKRSYEEIPVVLFISAVIMIAVNLSKADFSVYRQFSANELIPIAAITVVIFLLKTGVLSGILVGLKELWQQFRKK